MHPVSNYVISISREFGSGGRLIGKRLAARLGIPCYDRTIIQKTSEKSGLSPDFIARADEGPCVIVGRCSDYVLGERPECLKVFVHADMASRVERCVEEYHIPSDDMERRIVQMDKGRANYYNYYTGHIWGDMRRYDLTLNSGMIGVEGAVELIVTLVKARSAQDAQ